MTWLAIALAHAGVAAFALAMSVHQTAAFGRKLRTAAQLVLRVLGGGLLLGAALAFSVRTGWQTALVTWLAALSATAFIVTLTLSYRPRWLPWSAGLVLVVVAIAAAM